MKNKLCSNKSILPIKFELLKQDKRKKIFIVFMTVFYASIMLSNTCFGNQKNTQFNILDYGAVSDGITNNAEAINNAIKAASENGGGTVFVPSGEYMSGPIILLSNVTLFLEAGSLISSSKNVKDFLVKEPEDGNYLRRDIYTHLIAARDCENISIVGHGIIDGNAMTFMKKDSVLDLHYALTRELGNSYWIQSNTRQGEDFMTEKLGEDKNPNPYLFGPRPNRMISIRNCNNVTFEGVTIQNSPNWAVAISGCNYVNIHSVKINSFASNQRVPNDDGINLMHCNFVHISNCDIQSSDDAIALGGKMENLTITNCNLSSMDSGIRVGYMTSQMRNCIFNNINIFESTRGIIINIRRSGIIKDLLFDNITIQTKLYAGYWWGKGEPIQISSLPLEGTTNPGEIRNLRFSNIIAESEAGIIVYGCEESIIKNIHFDDIQLKIIGGPNIETLGGNFDLRGAVKPELAVFKHDIPGMFCKYTEDITIRNFKVDWGENLPGFFTNAVSCEDFHGLLIDGLYARQTHEDSNEGVVRLLNGSKVTIKNSEALSGTKVFLTLNKVDGNIFLMNNNLSQCKEPFIGELSNIRESGNIMP